MSSSDNVNNTTTATVHWNPEGTPVATNYDDVYFSVDNGLAETRYVFIEQNQLSERWKNHSQASYVIAETGFGTGLNFLATWQHYQQFLIEHADTELKRLHFISFEKHPLALKDLSQALSQWTELMPFSQQLLLRYPKIMTPGCHRIEFSTPVPITLDIWIGDVHANLPEVPNVKGGLVHSWFLDGFAPSKNPDMWSQQLFNGMARISADNASLATFTAAGFVRRGLIDAGFHTVKAKGFGRKRDMLVGNYQATAPEYEQLSHLYSRQSISRGEDVAIIGAGIAGASLAYALVKRGVKVSLYEKNGAAALEASGNRQGAVYPLLSPNQPNVSDFFQHAFNYHSQIMGQLDQQGLTVEHEYCGLIQLGYDEKSLKKNHNIIQANYPKELVYPVSAEQASTIAGVNLESEALYYPLAGWINAKQCVQTLLESAEQSGLLTIHYDHELTAFKQDDKCCVLSFGELDKVHDNIAFCHSHRLLNLPQTEQLPLTPVRGQVSHINTNSQLSKLATVLCYEGYLTPASNHQHCIGASYVRNNLNVEMDAKEAEDNLAALRKCQPQAWNNEMQLAELPGRAATRCAVRDHFPILGQVPKIEEIYSEGYQQNWRQQTPPYYQRCFMAVGFGSRGITSAPFASEILAAQLCGEPLPLKQSTLSSLHPHRFWNRRLVKKRPLELRYR
ncbi:bifunctional tRNA (5-methylaminomethyl-2-thiouridine)(34)-methyltransferase MnmD/FAD-dependent 5-carboxymethylaminomethyl-2-thiouridine(34) oxidoreductase MnmC [Agarivorans sp. 1_MG-2023]|uniref:bifunctional tRNA (5-methylaminomethyl-2-thiouridine)(34)-methyltransferase MnmD/FAD-dependent 5-carboxymethylaminomethyl-2-thiouridine(34) oxidoreductase MnmC n=1 Tax=Agarivorans sp. 1_MG-2023 TaxID=3062634 RepID=UPI0026E3691A|nr:bifunctional tRNA (5-methylaminomethyl-2-thiouridine)(34)-methyltransferase MnmD/FAD-dependent 5-carboxymethylaminomethyl-2-thiouridine(34) oxidoreductase MnmC [Agarivorans sp. 1_MG-2023]MDO6764000.1 bifunctional tRNA (5-methylaminomethyl-2-thiouridine)(34)-methyltransferase MnmD/FAD-dependent 5-carboxymethylaminomethyl-2-thiouridine(34) oxidoreductase MnmC [Agarivorans sp. 1_MG-2023]